MPPDPRSSVCAPALSITPNCSGKNQAVSIARASAAGMPMSRNRRSPSLAIVAGPGYASGRARVCGNRQAQRQRRRFRHADVSADEPVGGGGNGRGRSGRDAGGGRDSRQQPDVAVMAVADHRPGHVPAGCGPGQRSCVETGRQGPGDRRRRSGIAGVAPVRVPAGRQGETQRHVERPAGNDIRRLGDEGGDGDRRRGGPRPGVLGRCDVCGRDSKNDRGYQ